MILLTAFRYFLSISISLLVIVSGVGRKKSLQATVRQLTENNKEWVLIDTQIKLGNGCQNGEVLIFLQDNSVIHKLCENSTWKTSIEKWSIANVDDEINITINGQVYNLIFGTHKKKAKLILRKYRPGKKQPTTDRIFLAELE